MVSCCQLWLTDSGYRPGFKCDLLCWYTLEAVSVRFFAILCISDVFSTSCDSPSNQNNKERL